MWLTPMPELPEPSPAQPDTPDEVRQLNQPSIGRGQITEGQIWTRRVPYTKQGPEAPADPMPHDTLEVLKVFDEHADAAIQRVLVYAQAPEDFPLQGADLTRNVFQMLRNHIEREFTLVYGPRVVEVDQMLFTDRLAEFSMDDPGTFSPDPFSTSPTPESEPQL